MCYHRRHVKPSALVQVGSMVLSGIGPEQMDGAAHTFASFPLMILVTLLIVTVVIGAAFRSVLVPIRAVVCIVWMLAIVFGAALFIYQKGALKWLGITAFSPDGDALFWMSPCIAFSIVVGLGLDYDVGTPQTRCPDATPGVRGFLIRTSLRSLSQFSRRLLHPYSLAFPHAFVGLPHRVHCRGLR